MLLLGNCLAQETPAKTPKASFIAAPSAKQTPTSAQGPATASRPRSTHTKNFKDKFITRSGEMGRIHKQAVPVDPNILGSRPEGGLAGSKTLLTDEEAQKPRSVEVKMICVRKHAREGAG